MFKLDFSSYRYVSGQVELVEEFVIVDTLSEAIGQCRSIEDIGLLNFSREFPEVLRVAFDREWAANLEDEWLGARFENLSA